MHTFTNALAIYHQHVPSSNLQSYDTQTVLLLIQGEFQHMGFMQLHGSGQR